MSSERIESITFTRFLAAVAIVIFHYGLDIFPFNGSGVGFLFKSANIGVSYFFVLSGFVMVVAYAGRGVIDPFVYYKSRIARIYPIYLFVLLLCFVILLRSAVDFDYFGFLLNILMLQAWVPGKVLSFNTPGWSLSVEMFFYVLFPFLFNKIYRIFDRNIVLFVVVILFFLSQVLFNISLNSDFYAGFPSKSHDLLHYFPLMHLNEFLIGNVAGLFFVSKSKIMPDHGRHGFLIALLFIVLLIALRFPIGLSGHNGLLAIIFLPLIIFISRDVGVVSRIFSLKPFVFLGEISYSIYILQLPVKVVVDSVLKGAGVTNASLIFYTYFSFLIFVSGISYVCLETPLRKRINGFRSGAH